MVKYLFLQCSVTCFGTIIIIGIKLSYTTYYILFTLLLKANFHIPQNHLCYVY